jgi:AraC-like DNA-binding protein
LVYEFKHSLGERVTPHHHEIYEILYFLDGEGIIQLGHEQYPVNSDTMVLISPFTPHAVFAHTRMTVLVLAFEDFLQGFPNSRELFSRVLNRPKYHHLNTLSANELRDTFRKILYEQNHNNSFSDLTTQSHLLHLLVILAREWEMEQVSDSNAHRASVLRRYIESHYFDYLTSEDLASMLKLTPRHMNTIFKEQFGLTPMQYLNDVRVNHANSLLSDTDKEIVSICFETGFEAVSTFYRTFKNKVGVSPQQYRKTFQD